MAIGASQTYGSGSGSRNHGGVPVNEAYPVQLEALLKQRGIDAHVVNAGVPGQSTMAMLANLDSAVLSFVMFYSRDLIAPFVQGSRSKRADIAQGQS